MIIKNSFKSVDIVDGSRTWSAEFVLTGLLEVQSNSSASTIKILLSSNDLKSSDRVVSDQEIEVIVMNSGISDFTLSKNPNDYGFIKGNTTVPAGGFRLVKIIVSQSVNGSGVFCI